jgi:hypothetical protein
MKKKISKHYFFTMTLLFSLAFVTPTYAKWFGWGSNNDCVALATPDDSHNQSACIGGTESFYLFGIKIATRPEAERYGSIQ